MDKESIKQEGKVTADDIYVDGNRIGDIGNIVIKDRKLMSKNGILIVIANIDITKKELLTKPAITTRGYILVNENEELLKAIELKAQDIINHKLKDKTINFNDLKNEIIASLMPFLIEKTGRSPIILPILMDVKKKEA